MNRDLIYPGALPLDTDVLYPQQQAMIAVGALIQSAFGPGTFVDGLPCTQTTVPSLSVTVGQGWIGTLTTVEPNAYGALGADAVTPLMKMGINLQPTNLGPLSPPATSGQSVVYLVQAAFSETDGSPVVLPYYNAANPSVPYVGPGGGGAAQNTRRTQTVTLQLKQGTAATTGSQSTPAPDSGFTGLWAITIANGATTVVNANIAMVPAAPFIPFKLGAGMNPGFSRMMSFSTPGTYTFVAPSGVTRVKYRGWAGGAGGGGCNGTNVNSGGGGAGGYFEGVANVTPGGAYSLTVGAGGNGGNGTPTAGTAGGSTSFSSFGSANSGTGGGQSGVGGSSVGGTASGGVVNVSGSGGSGGLPGLAGGGGGGSSFGGGQGGLPGSNGGAGAPGNFPGGGGAGTQTPSGGQNGGVGGGGLLILEF